MRIKSNELTPVGQMHGKPFRQRFSIAGPSEYPIVYICFVLLLLSATTQEFAADLAKLFWLFSFGLLSIVSIGSAFGIYIASVIIYNPKHVWLAQSFLDRMDTYALLIMVPVIVFVHVKPNEAKKVPFLAGVIGLFLIQGLGGAVATSSLSWFSFAEFLRSFGLPMLIFLLLRISCLSVRDVALYCTVILILGIYLGTASILERFGYFQVLIPYWIAGWYANQKIGVGRSGGPFLQPEFNGFALGLMYCIILGKDWIYGKPHRLLALFAACLCLTGVFFTYTRGAWLAVALGSIMLLFSPLRLKANWALAIRAVGTISVLVLMTTLFVFSAKTALVRVGDKTTIEFRTHLWEAGLGMVLKRPLLGHGLSQFERNVSGYAPAGASIEETGTGAHNIFMSLAVEQGMLGLVLFILIIFQMYRSARASISILWGRAGKVWLLAMTSVYFINAQFLNAHEPANNLIYFGTLGMIAGLKEGNAGSKRAAFAENYSKADGVAL